MENFFLFFDDNVTLPIDQLSESEWQALSCSTVTNKPLTKTLQCRDLILSESPDILFVNEVGGKESLQNFNHYFLEDKYDVKLIEGNSDRGIDVGYLVKKNLPYRYLHLSHCKKPLQLQYPNDLKDKIHYISRDISELRLFHLEEQTPCLVLLNVHLKSKLDPEKIDAEGRKRRQSECELLVKIYSDIDKEVHSQVPIIIAGDFNGNASQLNRDPEFQSLDKTTLIDPFDKDNLPLDERVTKIHFPKFLTPIPMQLDYFLLSPIAAKQQQSTNVIRFKDGSGHPLPHPQNQSERNNLPSDHYPIQITLLCP